jgi:signal peptidase II
MLGVDRNGRGWRAGLFLLIAAFVAAIDQTTKLWIRSHLALGESLPEVGFVRLTHLQNTGSAFGLFANQAFLLTLIAIVGLVLILLFYRYLSEYSVLGISALGLVFGGAVGNLIDRIRLRYVTDFIDVRLWHDFHWPAFNVADSAITVGTITLVWFISWVLRRENGHFSGARK